jgi:hypothetical protein
MSDYITVPSLASVYLEDSFVLDIVEQPDGPRFRLEAVLTKAHPAYRPPKPGEQYCYATGWLIIPDVTRLKWEHRSTQRYTDATGEEELDNIDFLTQVGTTGSSWRLGHRPRLHHQDPRLTLDQPTPANRNQTIAPG